MIIVLLSLGLVIFSLGKVIYFKGFFCWQEVYDNYLVKVGGLSEHKINLSKCILGKTLGV